MFKNLKKSPNIKNRSFLERIILKNNKIQTIKIRDAKFSTLEAKKENLSHLLNLKDLHTTKIETKPRINIRKELKNIKKEGNQNEIPENILLNPDLHMDENTFFEVSPSTPGTINFSVISKSNPGSSVLKKDEGNNPKEKNVKKDSPENYENSDLKSLQIKFDFSDTKQKKSKEEASEVNECSTLRSSGGGIKAKMDASPSNSNRNEVISQKYCTSFCNSLIPNYKKYISNIVNYLNTKNLKTKSRNKSNCLMNSVKNSVIIEKKKEIRKNSKIMNSFQTRIKNNINYPKEGKHTKRNVSLLAKILKNNTSEFTCKAKNPRKNLKDKKKGINPLKSLLQKYSINYNSKIRVQSCKHASNVTKKEAKGIKNFNK